MKYEYLKGSEKDFEGAPEWATLYTLCNGEDYFFAEYHGEGARVYDIEKNNEFKIEYHFDGSGVVVIAERRPITEPEWDGVGLAPVGCECEFRKMMRGKPDEFRSGVVSYLSEHTVVIIVNGESGEFVHHPDTCEFRQLRTEADKKRDDVIEFITGAIDYHGVDPLKSAGFIYDAIAAGKIPGVKLED